MMQGKELWIDTRLNQEEMDFLWSAISEENKESFSGELAGNISKSELIKDKDNWFYETVLKKLTERMFYRNCSNYYKDYIEKETPSPEFELTDLWVNYQKQHEFNPIHFHNGGNGFSFVIFMRIPTHWKEQHALPISANSNSPSASDFQFVWSEKNSEMCTISKFTLSPEDEGRILFFPASLKHMVYPFYGTEEERITISGNVDLYDPNKLKEQTVVELPKEKILEMLENSVKLMKEELKMMKKSDQKRSGVYDGKPLD